MLISESYVELKCQTWRWKLEHGHQFRSSSHFFNGLRCAHHHRSFVALSSTVFLADLVVLTCFLYSVESSRSLQGSDWRTFWHWDKEVDTLIRNINVLSFVIFDLERRGEGGIVKYVDFFWEIHGFWVMLFDVISWTSEKKGVESKRKNREEQRFGINIVFEQKATFKNGLSDLRWNMDIIQSAWS